MDRADVLAMYLDGVRAVRVAVRGWSGERWARPACGEWTGTDVAGHLLSHVRWHHAWLDRAESGHSGPPFAYEELAERNRRALVGLRPTGGADRVELFAEVAEQYAERLDSSSWALAYGFPLGTVPAGTHAAVAAAEWHLHAWDLSGGTHVPADPRSLLVSAIRVLGATRSNLLGRLAAPVAAPVLARRHPWERLLRRSGRVP